MLRELFKENFSIDVEINVPNARKDHSHIALKTMEKVMLPFLLKGPGGQRGLMVLDGAMIDALIELQMLDKVLPTPRLDRPITTIDAGLSEGFVHLCLKAMREAPGLMSELSVVQSEQDRATLRLALNDAEFDIMTVQIDMGPGIKTGMFELWLPITEVAKVQPAEPNPQMEQLLAQCEAEFEAQMVGCKVVASELVSLAPGSVIRLSSGVLTEIAFVDCDDRRVATGRLGQLNGMRAIMITEMAGGPKRDPSDAQAGLPGPAAVTLNTDLPQPDIDLPQPQTDLPQPDMDFPQPDIDLPNPGVELPDLPMTNVDLPDLEEGGDFAFDPSPASVV